MKITPIILSGGSGTRLWPLSRPSQPKQFINLSMENTLFEQTLLKCKNSVFTSPVLVASAGMENVILEHCSRSDVSSSLLILEPFQRNTAPAILAAAIACAEKDPNGTVLILPSDHYIPSNEDFMATIETAYKHVSNNKMVIFGIKPDRYETGYGYIKAGKNLEVKEFREKPNIKQAKEFVDSGRYFWNAGIILASCKHIIQEAEKFFPETLSLVKKAIDEAERYEQIWSLSPEHWDKIQSISFDYAILEKTKNLQMACFSGEWSDLGDWSSLKRELSKKFHDENNNTLIGKSYQVNSSNNLLWAENKKQILAVCGLKNMIVIACDDAILVANEEEAQSVKQLITKLRSLNISEDIINKNNEHKWGYSEKLSNNSSSETTRLTINYDREIGVGSDIGDTLIVVEKGELEYEANGEYRMLAAPNLITIPKGQSYLIKNIANIPTEIIMITYGEQ